MSEGICRICEKSYTNLLSHLKAKHGISMEEHDALQLENLDIEPDTTIKMEVQEETPMIISKGAPGGDDTNITLIEYLNSYKMSKKELDLVITNYKKGLPISGVMGLEVKRSNASNEAKSLSSQMKVQTHSLMVAEELKDKHGFKVTNVRGPQGNTPKTWFLEKK